MSLVRRARTTLRRGAKGREVPSFAFDAFVTASAMASAFDADSSSSSVDSSMDHPMPMAPTSAFRGFPFLPVLLRRPFAPPAPRTSPPPMPAAIAKASRSSSTDAGGASTPADRPSSRSRSRRSFCPFRPYDAASSAFVQASIPPRSSPPLSPRTSFQLLCAAKFSMYRSSPYASFSSHTREGVDWKMSSFTPGPSSFSSELARLPRAASSPSLSARRSPSTVRTQPSWSGSRTLPVTSDAPGGSLLRDDPDDPDGDGDEDDGDDDGLLGWAPRERATGREAASTAVTAAATAAANPSRHAAPPDASHATQHATVAHLAPSTTSSVGKKK